MLDKSAYFRLFEMEWGGVTFKCFFIDKKLYLIVNSSNSMAFECVSAGL